MTNSYEYYIWLTNLAPYLTATFYKKFIISASIFPMWFLDSSRFTSTCFKRLRLSSEFAEGLCWLQFGIKTKFKIKITQNMSQIVSLNKCLKTGILTNRRVKTQEGAIKLLIEVFWYVLLLSIKEKKKTKIQSQTKWILW